MANVPEKATSIAIKVDLERDPVQDRSLESGPAFVSMLFVPLPLIATLLLLILLAQLIWREHPASRSFQMLVACLAALSAMIGLRWGYGMEIVLLVQPILAALSAALSWVGFRNFIAEPGHESIRHHWPHILPACLIVLLMVVRPQWIDIAVIAILAAYGIALVRLAWFGPDALDLARFDEAPLVHRSLEMMAGALLISAVADTLISIDMRWFDGLHSAAIVTAITMPMVLFLGVAAAFAGRQSAEEPFDASRPALTPATREDSDIVRRIDDLMRTDRLFRNHDLNLRRLARKAGIPARRISMAINRVHGRNVSQYVNDLRVAEACRCLSETDLPITVVMFEAGFLTKSNFNREFRRVTGTNPTDWKTDHSSPSSANARMSGDAGD